LEGKDVLRLHGVPYWSPPDHVLQAAAEAVTAQPSAHSQGFLEFRKAIANKLERDDGILADPEKEILVTNAAMHALNTVFSTLLDPGDEVAMYTPSFFYYGALQLFGAIPIYAETRQEDSWRWDVAALERTITPKTKMIIVNTPTNPTGFVAAKDDLLAIAELARKHDLLVVSDSAYDSMVYDGARHLSFGSLPGVKDRTISVQSFTKSYAMPGWRIGFVVAPAELTPYLRKALEWNVLSCNHVAQRAAQAALEGPQDWVKEIAHRFQRCRDLMVDGLRQAPGITFAVPKGAPFLFLNVSELGVSDEEFSVLLMHKYGVPTDPGRFFGSNAHVRLEIGGDDVVIQEATKRISAAARKLMDRN
jgi:aminotransferase